MEQSNAIPPHDTHCERGLCSCAILDPRVIEHVGGKVKSDDFYHEGCRDLWKAIVQSYQKGKDSDIVMIRNRLKEAGGNVDDATIAEILHTEIVPYNAGLYAEIIAENATRRRFQIGAMNLLNMAGDQRTPIIETIAACETLSLVDEYDAGGVQRIDDVIDQAIASREKGEKPSIQTGFSFYDSKYDGFRPGQLIILAGTTGTGKSSFALQIASNISSGKPVMYHALEMSAEELGDRIIDGGEERNVRGNMLYVDDRSTVGIGDIAHEARRRKSKDGLGLIVVDYLQLMKCDDSDKKATRERQVAALTRGLKRMARDLETPVLCLSQLNRKADESEKPMLSHLRESGAIEQDADVVIFINRKTDKDASDECELIVAKHRSGEPQTFPMLWHGEKYQFSETEFGRGKENFDDYGGFDPDEQIDSRDFTF